ncbi:MAG: cytochrome c oxidase subunit 3 [Phaeodactylibacter sp.]|nr:cytochrome c oxidase subunit 3 [Phaeodactylibacter sp.]
MNVTIVDDPISRRSRNRIHPHKFALYVACASMLMLFAAFTSAMIVRQAAGNWQEFQLPNIFYYNTAILLVSSISLQASYYFFKKGQTSLYRWLMVLTFILGLAFIVYQYQGWLALQDIGIFLDGNPSGSFVYVISGMHAAHVLGGIGALTVALLHAFILPHKATAKRKTRFELVLTFWHFLGFLWVYLLGFFTLQF